MLNVLKSGFYTTLQDSGRFNYRNVGVPVSGAMDAMSYSKINALLENNSSDAVLEITMTGPTLLFEEETYMVLGGAEFSATLNNLPIQNYKVYKIAKGDILSFGRLEAGFRAYLAVKGGFHSKSVLESTSYYKPLTEKSKIDDNDRLPYNITTDFSPKITELKVASFLEDTILEVSKGPEFRLLNDKQLENIFSKSFSVSNENNRMAYQLEERLAGHSMSMITSATLPGTVQITPVGKMMVLMKDGQTTGGYPRILQLTNKAICILSQKKEGDSIRFKLV